MGLLNSTSIAMDSPTDAPNPYQVNVKIMIAAIVVLFSVILFILSLHMYAKWFWKSSRFAARRRQRILQIHEQHQQAAAAAAGEDEDPTHFVNLPSQGLDQSLIDSLPLFVATKQDEYCSVCLSEVTEGELGRTLPKCGHSFHIECIDMWLNSHTTCPLCRQSLLENEAHEGCTKVNIDRLLFHELAIVISQVQDAGPSTSSSADDLQSASAEEHKSVSNSARSRWTRLRRMLGRISSQDFVQHG